MHVLLADLVSATEDFEEGCEEVGALAAVHLLAVVEMLVTVADGVAVTLDSVPVPSQEALVGEREGASVVGWLKGGMEFARTEPLLLVKRLDAAPSQEALVGEGGGASVAGWPKGGTPERTE